MKEYNENKREQYFKSCTKCIEQEHSSKISELGNRSQKLVVPGSLQNTVWWGQVNLLLSFYLQTIYS